MEAMPTLSDYLNEVPASDREIGRVLHLMRRAEIDESDAMKMCPYIPREKGKCLVRDLSQDEVSMLQGWLEGLLEE